MLKICTNQPLIHLVYPESVNGCMTAGCSFNRVLSWPVGHLQSLRRISIEGLNWSSNAVFSKGVFTDSLVFFVFPPAAVKQLKETVSSSIHKLANFDGKSSNKLQVKSTSSVVRGLGLGLNFSPYVYVCMCAFVEVMDAHLQNNQTAADDILASPDRLKGRGHALTNLSWMHPWHKELMGVLPLISTLHLYAVHVPAAQYSDPSL